MMSIRIVAGMACLLVVASAGAGEPHGYVPKEGFVPDEATAVRIAEAVWIPIYGKEKIRAQKPFHVALNQGVWTVMGTLPPNTAGGTAIALISKTDGRIIRVSHGK